MKKFILLLFLLVSCITIRIDSGDPDNQINIVFFDITVWVKVIINQPRVSDEYKNLELKRDKTYIYWENTRYSLLPQEYKNSK